MGEFGRESAADSVPSTSNATSGDVSPAPRTALEAGMPEKWRRSGNGMTLLAAALAIGIVIGWNQPTPLLWPWLIAAAFSLAAAIAMHIANRAGGLCMAAMLLAMMFLGAAWVTLRHDFVEPDDLAALIGDESTLVRLEGVATRAPELRSRTSGSLARFDYRGQSTYVPLRIERIVPATGEPIPVHGAVLLRVDQTLPPFHAGDTLRVTGFLLRPAMPRNPGEFDFRRYAESLGQAGILTANGRDLVQVFPAKRSAIMSWLLHWRDEMRHRASAWLLADLPERDRNARDAMLVSLLLGERDADIDAVNESFRRVGLAHILAISGFHLAVLAGFVLLVARMFGGSRAWHGWIVIAAVLLYLALVEPRMPVLRAGVMTIAGCLGMAFGRRLRVSGLIALSAILLLLWRPDQLFNAGFQLTYGVVLGLVHLVPPVRVRWFGRPNLEAATTGEMLGEWLKTALVVTVTAWLVATPIAAFHFGTVALVGIPMSIVAVPLSAMILAIGYVKIVLGAILPSAALLLGVPLTISADVLLALVHGVDRLPFSSVHVPPPSTTWALVAVASVCWWCAGRRHERRSLAMARRTGLVAVMLWLIWPLLPLPLLSGDDAGVLRIDMLAVGDGSCYIVRSGDQTMIFDAGSSTDLNAGDRSIIPAMRRLGVRSVDRICITHANLDHYSAVLEIAEEFDVGEVRVTPQFLAAAQADPLSSMAYLLGQLASHRVRVMETHADDAWTLGECAVRCLHPRADESFERVNDASMVLRIAAGDRHVLLCGDIQARAMATLMRPDVEVRADVMELPHHGSYTDTAVAFVERVGPQIVMQSTGWTRWQRDRWQPEMAKRERLVTVRDGACSVIIARDGGMRVERFLGPGVQAGGAEIE